MTKDEILSMAREAGFMPAHDNRVQRFAALVAEKATEQANARQNSSWALMCKKMVAAERDRFALECIDLVAMYGGPVDLEAAIRAKAAND